MTKKDYILIADILRYYKINRPDNKQQELISQLSNDLCVELEKDNPRFDRVKFEKAVGF